MASTGCCCPQLRFRGRGGENREDEESSSLLHHKSTRHQLVPVKDYDSLDYDRCYNEPFQAYINKQTEEQSAIKLEAIKWTLFFLVGIFTGMVALFIDAIVKLLTEWKFNTVEASVQVCSKEGCLALSLLLFLLFNVSFVIIAAILVVIEPVAAGSGIPEIKCYLNGIRVPRVARLRTLVCKAVGVLFSVAGGLFVGKEGPMIHSGAIIGAGVPQFQSLAFRKINFKYSFFRTDRDKRDFVSGGAAAGVAAAFGAPIGGVLFSLEEGSSFWNQKLTWRTFFCSMSATFSLNFFLSGMQNRKNWGYFYLPGLINFGFFKCGNKPTEGCHLWNAIDLFIFVLMGVIGGLLGALFNSLNRRLTVHRMKHIATKQKIFKVLESCLIVMVTTTVAFMAAMTLGECKAIPPTDADNSTGVEVEDTVRTFFCPPGNYNDMATLFFNPQEVAIKQLFHQPGTFSMSSLGIFFLFFYLLACWTYGAGVPSGLFVPSLLCGAAYGRFVATLLENVIGYQSAYSGTYALIGAAAFLGGVVRMTISLTVILIESTNEISYGLPIMLVLMVAKWTGDFFNEGLYDIHIELKGVPLLEWEPPAFTHRLTAKDIMCSNLKVIFPQTRVASLIKILKTTRHHAYPVVTMSDVSSDFTEEFDEQRTPTDSLDLSTSPAVLTASQECRITEMADLSVPTPPMKFEGIILRSQIVVLMKKQAWASGEGCSRYELLKYESLTEDYPRFPDILDLDLAALDKRAVLDVRPYMNPCPYTVFPATAVPQVFNLFRSMGLRHLPVVSHSGMLQGMITRHNLTHHSLEDISDRKKTLIRNSSSNSFPPSS